MRVCRYILNNTPAAGFYNDNSIVPLADALRAFKKLVAAADFEYNDDLLALLPGGPNAESAHKIDAWLTENKAVRNSLAIPVERVQFRAPIPNPSKILLLAGNYAAHIEEEGKIALERAETFPYLFTKPSTTVNHPNTSIRIPRVSPDHIDYECELGVVIGRVAKHVSEANALDYVAGYTVVNDISDRQYKPFPERKPRDRDAFFDWMHGKWHDGFFPMGPCLVSARTIPNPQNLRVEMRVNDEVCQSGTTAQMIYPVAAIIAFITQSITLHPGDIIATGTPAGVGMTSGRYLKPGDTLDSHIDNIGTLHNVMATEG